MQMRDVLFILLGYFCGSILFARVFGKLLCRRDVTADGDDRNPGTANAFKHGGVLCGTLTLLFDMLKGIVPVFFYVRGEHENGLALALVLAAPVLGHVFSVFSHFNGGKGIAASFGALLGLFPTMMMPALILAAAFIFFSVVVKVSPHYYRTIAAYSSASVLILVFSDCPLAVSIGFLISAVAIMTKLRRSTEEKESLEVKLAWKH